MIKSQNPKNRKPESISITEFKAKCLEVVRTVQELETPYVITKHGKPVAEVQPVQNIQPSDVNPLKDSILSEVDVVSPIDEFWDADLDEKP